ncbi:MAG: hypothetical protein H7834_07255 [Magnetococcus sp. YQC-9]
MHSSWVGKGSRWWKFDFHTHTPASRDYKAPDITPEEWLQAARDAQLDAVVITDHNSGEWVDRLKQANERMQQEGARPLVLFPGVEITVGESSNRVHLLAMFDPTCDGNKITAVLGGCGIYSNFGDSEGTSTTTGFVDTVARIKEAGGIAILAHIDQEKGVLHATTTLNPETKKTLENDHILAAEFYDLEAFDRDGVNPELRKVVARLARVQGSDAHRSDIIGERYSWLKMSRLNLEGVRIALLDHRYCVRNQQADPNSVPDIFVRGLTIQQMQHCGRDPNRPCHLELHPHLNTLIGGRGTGKSTMIESMRIAARRDAELKALGGKLSDQLEQFMKRSSQKGVMIEKKTEIFLEIQKRNKRYRLRWMESGSGNELEEWDGSNWQPSEAGNLLERFPLSIYSQKQIYELALNPKGILAIIDRAPEIEYGTWKEEWTRVERRFLELRSRMRELNGQLVKEGELRTKLKDLENDIRDYEEKGYGEVLKNYQRRTRQLNSLPKESIWDDLAGNIRGLTENAALPDFPEHLFEPDDPFMREIWTIHQQGTGALRQIAGELERLASQVEQARNDWKKTVADSEWNQAVQASRSVYETLVREYQEKGHATALDDYGKWTQQRQTLQQEFNRMESIIKEIHKAEKDAQATLARLLELRAELLNRRNRFLEDTIGQNKYVRMELVPFGDVSSVEEIYREYLDLGDKFTSSVYSRDEEQGILYSLIHWEDKNVSPETLLQKIQQVKSDTLAVSADTAFGYHKTFVNRLKDLAGKKPEVFDRMDVWWPEDLLRVRYCRDLKKPDKFEILEKGSAGQRAAAILAFLLSHGTDPMIIDQPEEDLDNALITDLVVEQMHQNKNRRQLIVVTHNPNIVVNADAELIHVMKSRAGQVIIAASDGMDDKSILTEISTILEGGREALEKRYRRLTLE